MLTKAACLLFVSLVLATPAWAVSYTGFAEFQWASLTFSGVAFTQTPRYSQQDANVVDVDFDTVTDGTIPVRVDNQSTFSQTGFVQPTVQAGLAGVGTATAFADSSSLVASANIGGVGMAQTFVEWGSVLTPLASGPLTVSLGYTLAHSGVPLTTGELKEFQAFARMQLVLDEQATHGVLVATTGDSSQSGILSLTGQMTAGVRSFLDIQPSLQMKRPIADVQSVPLPSMLWPTALLFVGLAGLVAWRRRRAL
jgi:hypothetical protein